MTKEELIKVYEIIEYLEEKGLEERIILELRNWVMKEAMEG